MQRNAKIGNLTFRKLQPLEVVDDVKFWLLNSCRFEKTSLRADITVVNVQTSSCCFSDLSFDGMVMYVKCLKKDFPKQMGKSPLKNVREDELTKLGYIGKNCLDFHTSETEDVIKGLET